LPKEDSDDLILAAQVEIRMKVRQDSIIIKKEEIEAIENALLDLKMDVFCKTVTLFVF
jgi:hypothetical protein